MRQGFSFFFTRCLGVSFRRAIEEKQQTTLERKEKKVYNIKDKVIYPNLSLSLSLSLSYISLCLLHALHRKPFLSLSLYVNYYTLSLLLFFSLSLCAVFLFFFYLGIFFSKTVMLFAIKYLTFLFINDFIIIQNYLYFLLIKIYI